MAEDQFDFKKSFTNLADIDNKVNTIVENYEHKTSVEIENKKRVVSILNKNKYALLNYKLIPILYIIVEMYKNLEPDRKDSILRKYSEDSNPIDEITDEIEMLRSVKATPLEETSAEKVELRKQKVETFKRLRVER